MPSRRLLSALTLFLFCLTLCAQTRAQTDERERALAEVELLRKQTPLKLEELREQVKLREQTLLSVPAADRERHAEFLSQPNTGLIRLLPREKWNNLLSVRGDGAYYSFVRLKHEYGHGSDIELDRDTLSVGFAGADFGFMTDLGAVSLETLSAETEAVQFMASFQVPSVELEARKAHGQFAGNGTQSGQWRYRDKQAVVEGSTYALRSVNYGRSDVLVAFRVLRKDTDGSVLLLWKILKQYPRPMLDITVKAEAGS